MSPKFLAPQINCTITITRNGRTGNRLIDGFAVTWQKMFSKPVTVQYPEQKPQIPERYRESWFDVAARVFARAGRPDLLTPCATADYPTKAKRPRYSVLDTERAEEALGGPLPNWEDAIDRFLSSPL